MIQEIEKAVLEHLKSKWPGVTEFDVGKGFANIVGFPTVSVTTERIGFEKTAGLSSSYYLLTPVISVYTVFKGLQPADRRAGVYPMITAAAGLLVGRNLGLNIEPLEPAGQIVEIFHSDIAAAGLAAFRIDVKTSFELDMNDDGELTRLLVTANDFMYRDYKFETQTVNLHNVLEDVNESDSKTGVSVPPRRSPRRSDKR